MSSGSNTDNDDYEDTEDTTVMSTDSADEKKHTGSENKNNSNRSNIAHVSNTSNNKQSVKQHERPVRRPGRPRIIPVRKSQPRSGVVSSVPNRENQIDLSYSEPVNLKKIWSFFKHMAIKHNQLIFKKDRILIYGKDHLGQCEVCVTIHGNKLNHYYCGNPLDIGLLRATMSQYTKTIDKDTERVSIVSKYEKSNNYINIIYTTPISGSECHTIQIIGEYDRLGSTKEEKDFDHTDYTIGFKFNSKYFKKKYTDIRESKTDSFSFVQESPTSNLMIQYSNKSKDGSSKIVYTDAKKLDFKSKLKNDESFRVSIMLDDIKAISTALLADYIHIYIDENKDALFVSTMDNGTIDIKVLVKIIDNRNLVMS